MVDVKTPASANSSVAPVPRSCTVFNETLNTTFRLANCTDDDGDDYDYDGEGWISPFDIPHIRALFIAAYSIVFSVCVIGNGTVIYVILRSRRMRSITNFFLANLAFADFCVGIFCILPTLRLYLDTVWTFGKVMCKLNYFIQQMAFVASVIILTVVAIERYVAIVYPMKSKQLTTKKRLIFFIVLIWSIAIFYNVHLLVVFDIASVEDDGVQFEFCMIIVEFNWRAYYTCNFFLWYFFPLVVMIAIYTKIGVVLWKSTMLTSSTGSPAGKESTNGPSFGKLNRLSRQNRNEYPTEGIQMTNYKQVDQASVNSTNALLVKNGSQASFHTIPLNSSMEQGSQTWGGGNTGSQYGINNQIGVSVDDEVTVTETSSSGPTCLGKKRTRKRIQDIAQKSKTGGADNVLKSRRKVVRLLVLVVSSFAVCALPFQVRVVMQTWGGSVPSIVPPIVILLMFSNSGLNPILYAFFSENFRRAMKEVFVCKGLHSRSSSRRDPLTSRTSAPTNTNTNLYQDRN